MITQKVNQIIVFLLLAVRDYVAADLRRVAKPFAVYKTLIHDVREIPLPASANVVSKVESVEPNLVKIRMQSQSKFVSVQNTFVYSTHSLFPGNVFPQLQPSDGKKSIWG